MSINRRDFLRNTAFSAAALGLTRFSPVAVAKASPSRDELVRLLIETDRDRLLERLVALIRAGLDYPILLGAVAEAAVRQVRPYPHVGFKYHAFMVLHAVHLTTLFGRPEDRWLPLLWAADVFKASQAAEQKRGVWALGPVKERYVPAADKAMGAFHQAMARWDLEAADAAVVGLARSRSREHIFPLFFRYGARDFRAIGHKAIAVANCHRLSGVVAREHLEPMLRSLVLALMNHEGEPNPTDSDLAPDRPWRRNLQLSTRMLRNPQPAIKGKGRDGQVSDTLDALRAGSAEDAGEAVAEGMDRGVSEQALWTAVFLAGGDMMLKQSGIISVHANTTANALHYAYRQVSSDPDTRRLILLQAAAFQPLFRDLLGGRRRGLGIDTLTASERHEDSAAALEQIFATISQDRVAAARETLSYLGAGGDASPFMRLARRYVVDRNVGYHDYKFAEAAFENAAGMEAPWHEPYLASSVLYLNGSADKPNAAVERARALLDHS